MWTKEKVIGLFKSSIAEEMGKTNSSLFARQTLKIVWRVADSFDWDPYDFCVKVGYRKNLIAELAKRNGCPGCGEWMIFDKGDSNLENPQDPSWVCLNHGVEVIIPAGAEEGFLVDMGYSVPMDEQGFLAEQVAKDGTFNKIPDNSEDSDG